MNREKRLIKIIQETFPESQDFIGDDAALVDISANKLAISTDNFIEGIHYHPDLFTPYDIGWKALAVNVSDMAAMAAKPLYFVVSIALAEKSLAGISHENWTREFYTGLYDCAKTFAFPKLIGGDLSAAINETAVAITIFGEAPRYDFLRSAAKPGDKVCVTGKFGNSGNFWQKFLDFEQTKPSKEKLRTWLAQQKQSAAAAEDLHRHLRPEPRIREALNLADKQNGALMDTSDGLAQALFEISEQSGVDIQIDSGLIPKDKHVDLFRAYFGAEDYELLGCFAEIPQNFMQIGEITKFSKSPSILDLSNGQKLEPKEIFAHFK